MTSTRLEDVTGIKDEIIGKALSIAMKAHKSEEKQYAYEKTRLGIFFGFPGSFSADHWFAPNNQKPFGETSTDREQFPCLVSIGNDIGARVNEAFLRKFEAVLTNHRSCQKIQSEVEKAVNERKQIVFTGHSSGGATATLMTVWFLENYLKPKPTQVLPPLCLTFGSPLVGDQIFSHALHREKWAQYFLHFVKQHDIVPRIMLAPKSSLQQSLPQILGFLNPKSSVSFQDLNQNLPAFYKTVITKTSSVANYVACKLMGNTNPLLEAVSSFVELSPYRPFGRYVFCTGNGKLVGVNNSDVVLQLLFYSFQSRDENQCIEIAGQSITEHQKYEHVLQGLSATSLIDNLDQLPLGLDAAYLNSNPINATLCDLGLSTQGRLCIRAAGEAEKQRLENQKKIDGKRKEISEQLDWIEKEYKKSYEFQNMGPYDSFKASKQETDFKANIKRAELAGTWDKIIEMLRKFELPDGFEGQRDWIELGTRYRRLVEPLDIANYYRHLKNEDTGPYMNKGRPKRYKYTQKWLEHAQWKLTGSNPEASFWNEVEEFNRRYNLGWSSQEIRKELKFTGSRCESCLWAEIEELSGKSYETIKIRAVVLEKMVERWISKEEIGKEVLLEESAFVKWWNTLPSQHRSDSQIPELIRSANS